MIVVKKDAKKRFLQALEVNNDQQCALLKVANISQFNLEETIDFITSHANDRGTSIFVCDDGDVLVLARCISQEFTNNLRNFLWSEDMEGSPLSADIVTFFDIEADRSKLLAIIKEKLEAKMRRDKEKEKIKKERNRQRLLTLSIPEHLLRSLDDRRERRAKTEVFVVEDDPFSRKMIKNAMPKDFELFLAKNGEEALQHYFLQAPDVLFLDIGLPDIDGHDVLRKILHHDPRAYIVMLSGKGDKKNLMKAVENGAKGFVGKPFTRERLLQYIEKSPHTQKLYS